MSDEMCRVDHEDQGLEALAGLLGLDSLLEGEFLEFVQGALDIEDGCGISGSANRKERSDVVLMLRPSVLQRVLLLGYPQTRNPSTFRVGS